MHFMEIADHLREHVLHAVKALFDQEVPADQITITPTRSEFEGDYTVLVFPLTRLSRLGPEETGALLGEWLSTHATDWVAGYNVIKGFLNIEVQQVHWLGYAARLSKGELPAFEPTGERVLVEFASPNTNKPLHLGHIRNILLGWSVSRILDRVGHDIARVQVVNDRGIAICKSMLTWKLFGGGATPASTGIKGDHFVGDYYVRFEQEFQKEYKSWQESEQAEALWQAHLSGDQKEKVADRQAFFSDYKNTYFNIQSDLGRQAREMLLAWEKGDPDTLALWQTMNGWVYEGFDVTYDRLGVTFDKVYYESNTFLLGKDIIEEGLQKGVFYQKEDSSVWVDLTAEKLDHKILLRSDGTSVYITQDIGTAEERFADFGANRMIYTVADEQNYHFQVLFAVLKRMGRPYADGLHHLSYGMVELPQGRMKSREGTVVDADDLMDEVIREAHLSAEELSDLSSLPVNEQEDIFRKVGMAALKFHIIKVNPRKKMIFDPRESVDMQGHTGPYIQNAYVRIQSILRKVGVPVEVKVADLAVPIESGERELLLLLSGYRHALVAAAEQYDPSQVANYAYQVARTFHRFYHDYPIMRAESEAIRQWRLQLAQATAHILRDALDLLGIEMPERM
jgi:arginyl-tRNA synthetase